MSDLRKTNLRLIIGMLLVTCGLAGCSSTDSPTQPSSSLPAISGVALNATSVGVGGTAQGTVTLSTAPTAGAVNVALTSSNPSAVTVPASVTIAQGATTATFAASAVGGGSATVSASLNGSSRQSGALSVSAQLVTLKSLTVFSEVVVGGDIVTGTATLTGPAPSGGAMVLLSATDPVSVPASVQIPGGSTSAPFTVQTRTVGGTLPGVVTGSYGGSTATVTVSVIKQTVAVANFGVTGPTQSETCTLSNGGATLDCTFDGTSSSAPGALTAWDWTYGVAKSNAQTTGGGILANPAFDCSLLPAAPLPTGVSYLTLVVTLVVHDNQGNVSTKAVHNDVRLLPQGACGY
jgi:hypothetical protein